MSQPGPPSPPRKPCILVVDDDGSVLVSLALLLKQSGFEVLACDDPAEVAGLLAGRRVDLVLQDMNFSPQTSGEEGLALLAETKSRHPALPVLLMTAWGSIALAVRGVKHGAADFFTKPWHNAQLVELVRTTLELSAPRAGAANPTRRALDAEFDFDGIIGEHPALLKVLETVGRVARTRAPVLILGESGTGKELVADAIHRNSPRAGKPAVKINMGAITSSLFESEMFGHVKGAFTDARTDRRGHVAHAQGSTLFMDEIGELHRGDQVKLLRVLQDQTYRPVGASASEQADIRVVSATNRELAEMVASGDFREDLYYRLNLITLRLPALRERRSDIPLIATRLVADLAADYGLGEVLLSPAALEWLTAQPWPGNVRQLRQVLERTLLLAGKPVLEVADLRDGERLREGERAAPHGAGPAGVGAGAAAAAGVGAAGAHLTLEQAERQMIELVLAQHEGNISRVAKALGLSRAALYRRMEKHGLATGADDAP
jgi:two-component system NtrC family response regulator